MQPAQVKAFARSRGTRAKTDRIDAELIARFFAFRPEAGRSLPAEKLRILRAFTSKRVQLVEMRKRLLAQFREHQKLCTAAMFEDIDTELKQRFDILIKELEDRITRAIASDDHLSEMATVLRSIPGIGPVASTILIAEMPEIGTITGEEAAALTGLAPVAHDSGTLRGKGPDIAGIRGALQASHDAYFDFFAGLLDQDGITLTGDITPLYAGLPGSVLAQIRDGFAARDIDVRVLFLMRDPVSRCISAAQMNRRKGDLDEGVPTEGSLDDAVLAYAQAPQERLRADYRRTVKTLRDTFPEDALYFGFYETMFGAKAMAALSRFAGVATRPELAERRVNTFAKSEGVSDVTRAALREILAPDYAFCLSAFPEITAHWTTQEKA